MANTTFDAPPGNAGPRSRGVTATERAMRRRDRHVSTDVDAREVGDALGDLRQWFESSNRLIEAPFQRHRACSMVLEILDRFVPCRQSALLLLEEGNEMLVVGAARGTAMTLSQATWVEQTARECLTRAQVLGRELPDAELSSFLWIPVLSEGTRVGVIQVADSRGRWFADTLSRELSVLADEVGWLLRRMSELEERDRTAAVLERKLESRARECSELRRQLSACSSQDAIAGFAVRIAERAIDPSTAILSNLQTAREDVESIQGVMVSLVTASKSLLCEIEATGDVDGSRASMRAAVASLDDAVRATRSDDFKSSSAELAPLTRDIEQGALALCSIGRDLRELSMADSAPIDWIDVSQLIEQALEVVAQREGQSLDLELRIGTLPPIHCQRLRVVLLLVSLLDHVFSKATPESAVGLLAELCGTNAVVELTIEGSSLIGEEASAGAFGFTPEVEEFHREIIEDHDARLDIEVFDELSLIRLSVPTDRE